MKLLITSDLHLRDKAPVSRIDPDWAGSQIQMLEEIVLIADEEEVDAILIAGDIFHKPKVSPLYEAAFIRIMQKAKTANTYIMPGQHDLPGHSMNNVRESSFGVLWSLTESQDYNYNIASMDKFCSWETFQDREIIYGLNKDIICVHRLVTPNRRFCSVRRRDLLPSFRVWRFWHRASLHALLLL